MPFKPGQSGNPKGRPKGQDLLRMKNKNDLGQKELHKILRGLKPLSKKAIARLGVILEDGGEQAQMRAAIYILDKYKDLVQELYVDVDKEETTDEELDSAPILSLTRRSEDS